ncbi:MAG: hypothetical protein ACXV8G_13695 [Acidimicrobiales bacterium]
MRRRVTAIAATVLVAGSFLFAAPASAQQIPEPSILIDAECSPDGSTQGFVITVTNNASEVITIQAASAFGSLLPLPIDLTITPDQIAAGASGTADFAVPGDAAGALHIDVAWFTETVRTGTAADFRVTACVGSTDTTAAVTTSTAAPARAAATTATFTG